MSLRCRFLTECSTEVLHPWYWQDSILYLSSDPRAYALGFPLQTWTCRRTVFWGFGFESMNLKFFCIEDWLQKPPGKAHVWWASPGCGVEGAFVRYGLLSSWAKNQNKPNTTPCACFMCKSSTIWKMLLRLRSSGNAGNGMSRYCWSAQFRRAESLPGRSRSRTGDNGEQLDQKVILMPQELRSFQGHSFGLRHLICQSGTQLFFLELSPPKLRV